MLLARAREAQGSPEGSCDAALEIEGLICGPPPPEGFRESLRNYLPLPGVDLVLRAPSEDPGSGETDLFPAGSSAEALDSLRRAWARSWNPGAIRAGRFPDEPGAVEAVRAASLPGRKRPGPGTSGIPGEAALTADPEHLGIALDRTEALLSAPDPAEPAILEEARETLVMVRYYAGRAYNRVVGAPDPFDFLGRIDSPDSGDPGADLFLGLVRRSFDLEERLVGSAGTLLPGGPFPGGPAVRDSRAEAPTTREARVHQLTGTASSPGRARGAAIRPDRAVPSAVSGPAGPHQAAPRGAGRDEGLRPALLCNRLTRGLLAAYPDAVASAERGGGRIGLGARLARSAGLPCVSGIRDLERIPEGVRILIDGDLGLLSLEDRG